MRKRLSYTQALTSDDYSDTLSKTYYMVCPKIGAVSQKVRFF